MNPNPCIPGTTIGATYRIEVLSDPRSASDPDGGPSGSCGTLGDLMRGTTFDVMLFRKGDLAASDCRIDQGRVQSLPGATLGTYDVDWISGPTGTSIMRFTHTIGLGDGCQGVWLAAPFVPDKGSPFRTATAGMESPVKMLRAFYSAEGASCAGKAGSAFAIQGASDVRSCRDIFDIKFEKRP